MVQVRLCEGDECKLVNIETDGPVSKDDVEPLVNDLIGSNDIVIFSKTYCPYCVEAKKLLSKLASENNNTLHVFTIDKQKKEVQAAMQLYLLEKTKQRTVPQIVIKKKWLGGCSDIQALHKKGNLVPLLN